MHSPFRFAIWYLVLLFALAPGAEAARSVTFAWQANPEPDIAGYRLYYGTASRSYGQFAMANVPTATVSNLIEGTTYFFAVTAYNSAGLESAFSAEVIYTVPGTATTMLANVSSRAFVQTGNSVVIGGFIIAGSAPKTVVLRAISPSLAGAGISQFLPDPVLDLLDSSGTLLASNDDWGTSGVDLFGLGLAPASDRESVLVATLPPGAYSAVVRGKNGAAGVALIELYDLDANNGRIANISTRARVETGEKVLIGGFILTGTAPAPVLVRAIGPSLSQSGVSNPLLDPMLELRDGNGSLIFTNDNWRSAQASQILATGLAPSDEREAALLATLSPGAYSVIVRGANGSSGVALFEIYALSQ